MYPRVRSEEAAAVPVAPRSPAPNPGASIPDEAALKQFVQLAGGRAAVIAIVASAAINPAGTGEAYAACFRQLGAREAEWLRIWQRWDANSAGVVAALQRATGIFIVDGDRAWLRTLLAETRAAEMILQRSREGTVIAGVTTGAFILPTSAGQASARSAPTPPAPPPADVAGAGIGLGLLAELSAEHHLGQAIEWSGF